MDSCFKFTPRIPDLISRSFLMLWTEIESAGDLWQTFIRTEDFICTKNSQILLTVFIFFLPTWNLKQFLLFSSGYYCVLMIFALQYGDVLNILISSKKKGSAVVEFASVKAAVSIFHLCNIYKYTTVWKQNSISFLLGINKKGFIKTAQN